LRVRSPRAGAGKLSGIAVQQRTDAQRLGGAAHRRLDIGPLHPPRAQAEGDVLEHREIRIKRVALEYHRDVAIPRPDVIDPHPVDLDRAAVGLLQAGDGAQQGRLSAPRGADYHGEFALWDLEVDATDGMDLAVILVQADESQWCHRVASP
jgi:hypothetical protein